MFIRRILMSVVAVAVLVASLGLLLNVRARGHCQIPCGIYDDPVRFTLLLEHTETIDKSIRQIATLSEEPGKNANQLVRWVQNKDEHADRFAAIVTEYFLQQRIAPVVDTERADYDAYIRQISLCHRMLVRAMKAKQTTDLAHTQAMRQLVGDFRKAYFGDKAGSGDHKHGP